MCGIFGFIQGERREKNCVEVCLQGLERLEYRGYDSAGIASLLEGKIAACKEIGPVKELSRQVPFKSDRLELVIGHTRWATNGVADRNNAHPHLDQHQSLAVVHNGIIENHEQLRAELVGQGVPFKSQTDSEVIAQIISYHYRGDLLAAVQEVLPLLHGSLALALIHVNHPNQIVVVARGCPLILAVDSQKNEAYLSSDLSSFHQLDLDLFLLEDGETAILEHSQATIFDFHGKRLMKKGETLPPQFTLPSQGTFDHFMLKEIYEQPHTLTAALEGRVDGGVLTPLFEELPFPLERWRSIDKVVLIGCGSSRYAGSVAALLFEEVAKIETRVYIASEFRYSQVMVTPNTLVIALSQSGETADTLAAARKAAALGACVIGICNVPCSSLAREVAATLFLKAGPEVSVCSTKAFTSLLATLSLFALFLGRTRGSVTDRLSRVLIDELREIPQKVEEVLRKSPVIEEIAQRYEQSQQFLFIGRGPMYPVSEEAALKMKEISYINALSYAAGELKHGPIALIDRNSVVVGMLGHRATFDKTMSNLSEVKARRGKVLAFLPATRVAEFNKSPIIDDMVPLPHTCDLLAPIPYTVAAQLLAYFTAKERGTNIDQPRNLAKSVTVE